MQLFRPIDCEHMSEFDFKLTCKGEDFSLGGFYRKLKADRKYG